MYTFQELFKKIRSESGLTQPEFAKALKISPALVAMVETGQKEPSKKLVTILAKKMKVHPSSIMPFLSVEKSIKLENLSEIERTLISWGEKMQTFLIEKKAFNID